MPKSPDKRNKRRQEIVKYLKTNIYSTDEELAKHFNVSVNTIRLDRQELKIKELKERIKDIAKNSCKLLTSLSEDEIVGELIDLTPGVKATAIFKTTEDMSFKANNIVRGHYIYALTESLAIAVIPADCALVGVANIKYKKKVTAGECIYAKAEVKKTRTTNFVVWIKIYNENKEEVFQGKFILKTI